MALKNGKNLNLIKKQIRNFRIYLVLLLSLFSLAASGQKDYAPILARADSLANWSRTDKSDALYQDVLGGIAKPGRDPIAFSCFVGLGSNQLDFFHFDEAQAWFDRAEEILENGVSIPERELGKYYLARARFWQYNNRFDWADPYFQRAIEYLSGDPKSWKLLVQTYLLRAQSQLRRNAGHNNKLYIDQAFTIILAHDYAPEILGEASLQLARFYRQNGNWEACLEQARKSEQYFKEAYGPLHPKVGIAIQYQSHYYDQIGDLNLQLERLQKAQALWEQLTPPHRGRMGQNEGLISNCYRRLGKYREAHRYIDRAINTLTQHLGDREASIIADMYRRKALIYEAQDSTGKAIALFESARSVYSRNESSNRDRSRSIQGLTRAYLAAGKLDSADYWNQVAIGKLLDAYGPDYMYLSESYRVSGAIAARRGQYREAIAWLQLALEKAAPNFKALRWEDLPRVQDFEFIPPALGIILQKGDILRTLAGEEQTAHYLEEALRSYLLGIDLIERLRSSYKEEDAREIIQADGARVFQGAISTLAQLAADYDRRELVDSIFSLANRGKAMILREALAEQAARTSAGIPDSLINKEQELREAITQLKYSRSSTETPSERLYRRQQLVRLHEEMENLRRSIQTRYPRYFALKFASPQVEIHRIQQELAADQAMIQYYLSDQYLLSFAVTRDTVQLARSPIPEDLTGQIEAFRRVLTDIDFIRTEKERADAMLLDSGHELFRELLAQPLQALPSGIRSLVIIPDGQLGYVPFEMLLTREVSQFRTYRELPFLLKDYAVSYAYSAILWQSFHQRAKSRWRGNLAAFAPTYGAKSGEEAVQEVLSMIRGGTYQELPGARQEARRIGRLMRGKVWLGAEASEANFKTQAPHFDLLHLSMHGILDDQAPMQSHLAFQQEQLDLADPTQDNLLQVAELYAMNLDAEMVVLSACNSGAGRLSAGEGIMSLARGFAYSGVRSVVMSLWSVPDQSTSELMVDFYRQLKRGKSKDEALRQSRLNYLESTADPLFSHPYFWSGFVVIGDARALPAQPWKWLLGLALVFLLIFLAWRIFLSGS